MKISIGLLKKIFCIFAMCISLSLHAQVSSGVDFDLNGYINQKLDAGEKEIVVPPGRYRVPESNNYHLYFTGRQGVMIIAEK